MKPFPRRVLAAGAEHAALRLLGALLVRRGVGVARIVETESYTQDDPASHSHRGPTPRNASMFAPAGAAYVYRSYGMHWCLNIATGRAGAGEAVLVRAVEPVEGLEAMIDARGWRGRPLRQLCDGPGKLCAALRIDGTMDGMDLLDPVGGLWLARGRAVPAAAIRIGPRVGITKAADWPRRYRVDRRAVGGGGGRLVST